MGLRGSIKKRGRGSYGGSKSKHNKHEQPKGAPEDEKASKMTADIDENCVQYHSDDENGTVTNDSGVYENGKLRENDDFDSVEADESGDEMKLEEAVAGESDVEVDIEFFDPRDTDISSIQMLLKRYIASIPGKKKVDGRSLAEAICKQKRVGTVVRVSEDEAPIAFISCLNMRTHAELLRPKRRYLRKLCEREKDKEATRFGDLLKSCSEGVGRFERERMGLILCERVVNLPPLVLPKMLEALFSEITWAREDEPTEDLKSSFRFGWYLYITQTFLVKKSEQLKQNGDANNDTQGEERVYQFQRIEDEIFFKHCSMKIQWQSSAEEGEENGVSKHHMAMLIKAERVGAIRKALNETVGFVEDEVQADNDNDTGEGGQEKEA